MKIPCFWEHNRGDTLLYAVDLPGAYARGESLPAAMAKMPAEIKSYLAWKGDPVPDLIEIVIAEERNPSWISVTLIPMPSSIAKGNL